MTSPAAAIWSTLCEPGSHTTGSGTRPRQRSVCTGTPCDTGSAPLASCSAATWTHLAPAVNSGWRWKSLLGNGDHGFAVGNEPLDDHPSAAGLRSRPHWAPLRHGAGVTAIDVQHTPGSTLTGGLSTACPITMRDRERRWGSSPRAGRAFGGAPWPGSGQWCRSPWTGTRRSRRRSVLDPATVRVGVRVDEGTAWQERI